LRATWNGMDGPCERYEPTRRAMTPAVAPVVGTSIFARPAADVLGVRVDDVSREELVALVLSLVASGDCHRVMYANVHVLNVAYRDLDLRRVLNQADLVYCDGAGVRVGARLLGYELAERMTGADWIHDLCQACRQARLTLYFLGGRPGVAGEAAAALTAKYPGLNVVGTHHGHYALDGPQNEAVIAEIRRLRPDILLVGFGTPLQERWIDRNFERLDVPVVWAVGALVDFVAGRKTRAPRWMLDRGLEWLYRLWTEPGRLWSRYLIGNPLFIVRVLRQRWQGGEG